MKLSEFHTGFRAYKIESLSKIPFAFNTDDFHFDTEIIIQAAAMNWKIIEVPIRTHYGEEVCHVNGIRYALDCVKSVLRFRLVQLGLYYQRNYDFGLFEADKYDLKTSPRSLHRYVIQSQDFHPGISSIELGTGPGLLSDQIASKVGKHLFFDLRKINQTNGENISSFSEIFPPREFDCCLSLDLIEHLDNPESFLSAVFQILKPNGKLYISTANICYLPMRISLLIGQFNYSKRGILDRTHKRLFSVRSFMNLLTQYGYRVELVRGFPPPLTDFISSGKVMSFIEAVHAFLSRLFPRIFAYNFLVVARRLDSLSEIFDLTLRPNTEEKRNFEISAKIDG